MTWDEMKNRISLALKDHILQQGFEIICKELDQERKLNAEIKARFVKCNTCTDEMKSKCLMFSENLCEGERCEELVDIMALVNKSDLQKENAELAEQIAELKDDNKVMADNYSRMEQKFYDNITKSKEWIRRFMNEYPVITKEVFEEAEQFLKE